MCLLLVCFAPVCFSPTCSVCACSQLLGFWLSFCSGLFLNSQKCTLNMSSSDKKQAICRVPILAWHQLFHLENGLMLSGIIKAANLLSAISIFLYTTSVSSRFEVKVIWDLLMCKLGGRYGGTHVSSDYLLLKTVVYMAIVSKLVRSAHY